MILCGNSNADSTMIKYFGRFHDSNEFRFDGNVGGTLFFDDMGRVIKSISDQGMCETEWGDSFNESTCFDDTGSKVSSSRKEFSEDLLQQQREYNAEGALTSLTLFNYRADTIKGFDGEGNLQFTIDLNLYVSNWPVFKERYLKSE